MGGGVKRGGSMRTAYLVVVAAMSTGAGAHAQGVSPTGPIHCGTEADCLLRLKGIARREGDVLRIKLQNGKTKIYKSDRKACDSTTNVDGCIVHEFAIYYPAVNAFAVDIGFYEGGQAEVGSTRTGQVVTLDTLPEFSPSGRWFVSVSNTEMGDRAYDVGIWSTAPDVPKQELRYRTPSGEPYEYWEFQGWDGDDRVLLSVSVNLGNGAMRDFETDAVRTEQGWKLNRPKL